MNIESKLRKTENWHRMEDDNNDDDDNNDNEKI